MSFQGAEPRENSGLVPSFTKAETLPPPISFQRFKKNKTGEPTYNGKGPFWGVSQPGRLVI